MHHDRDGEDHHHQRDEQHVDQQTTDRLNVMAAAGRSTARLNVKRRFSANPEREC
jgi:hypothetical protein